MSKWGNCFGCNKWSIELDAPINSHTKGRCTDEQLRRYSVVVTGDSGCSNFDQGEPIRKNGSASVPTTSDVASALSAQSEPEFETNPSEPSRSNVTASNIHANSINTNEGAAMAQQIEQAVIAEHTRPVCISWRAIFAGLVAIIAIAWIMSILGSAIGMSIADGTDGEALTTGMGYGVIGWILATGVVAFFLGGMLTARASGSGDVQTGMLHGFTMWAAAVVGMLVLGYFGIAALVNTGSSIVDTAVKATGNAAGSLSAMDSEGSGNENGARSSTSIFSGNIAARLKRKAAEAIAADEDSDISEEEARQVIREIDSQTLQAAASHLIAGENEAAEDIIAVNTNLTEVQVKNLVDGVSKDVEKQVNEFKTQAEESLETATTYAQGVLWTQFIGTLLSLIAAIGGGMFGANSVERLHTIAVTRRTTS
ncbi:hypothetical protein N9L06_05945 [Mariniblastus sp.]|nr:hypothetical protein [Mariniblastus sp.]